MYYEDGRTLYKVMTWQRVGRACKGVKKVEVEVENIISIEFWCVEFTRQTNFKTNTDMETFNLWWNWISFWKLPKIIIFKWLLYFLQVCKSVPGANLISSPAWGGVITDSVKTQTYKKSNQSKVFISIVRLTKNIKTYKDPSFINGFHIQTEWICLDCLTLGNHVDKSQPAISRCLCLEAENVRQVHIN